jgi:hypothetical protein
MEEGTEEESLELLFKSNWRISQLLVVVVEGAVVVGVVVVGAGLVVALLIETLAVDTGACFCFLNSRSLLFRALVSFTQSAGLKLIPGSMTMLGPVQATQGLELALRPDLLFRLLPREGLFRLA